MAITCRMLPANVTGGTVTAYAGGPTPSDPSRRYYSASPGSFVDVAGPLGDGDAAQVAVAEIDLPAQPFLPAAGGRLMSSAEPWRGFGVRQRGKDDGTVATSFRIYDLTGACRVQGDVGEGEGADLILSDCMIHAGQPINITSFKLVEL
jgi:hypothetical protein